MKFIFVFILLVISGCASNSFVPYTERLQLCYEKYDAKAYKKGDITYAEMENANREAHKASVMELEVRKK